jgi:hypothetical protein
MDWLLADLFQSGEGKTMKTKECPTCNNANAPSYRFLVNLAEDITLEQAQEAVSGMYGQRCLDVAQFSKGSHKKIDRDAKTKERSRYEKQAFGWRVFVPQGFTL